MSVTDSITITQATNKVTVTAQGSVGLNAGGQIDGNLEVTGTLAVGGNQLGKDVRFWGETANKYFLWDASQDKVIITGDLQVDGTTTTINSTVVSIADPVFSLGGTSVPTSSDSKDRGIEHFYYDTSAGVGKRGFFGWSNADNAYKFLTDCPDPSGAEIFTGTAGNLLTGNITADSASSSGHISIARNGLNRLKSMLANNDGGWQYEGSSGNVFYAGASGNDYVIRDGSFSTSGDLRFIVSQSGNVGIGGVTAPTSLLEIAGDLEISPTEPTINLNRNNGSYSWKIVNGAGGGNFPTSTFNIANNAGNPVITAIDSGKVGIGVATPTKILSVKSSGADDGISLIKSNSSSLIASLTQTGTGDGAFVAKNASDVTALLLRAQGNSYFNGGNLGIGVTAPATKLDVADKIRVAENSNVAFYGADFVRLFVNQSYSFTDSGGTVKAKVGLAGDSFFNGGNVGIGVTNPVYDLTVAGNIGLTTGTTNSIFLNNGNVSVKGDSNNKLFLNALDEIRLSTASTERLRIESGGLVRVFGDLQVDGTTTTVNSTVVTIDDPVLTLGGDTAPSSDDNKDRGIEFRYYDGSAKIGFMGWDDSAGGFTLLKDATNSSEVFSGTATNLTLGEAVLTDASSGSTHRIQATGNNFFFHLAHGVFQYSCGVRGNRGSSVGMESGGINSYLALCAGGSEKVRIATNGNVGIANNNPAQKLSVTGSAAISSTLYLGSESATGTRIQADSGVIRGFYTSGSDARFHLGRDAFAGGYAGLIMGGSGGYSGIGATTTGNDLLFSTNMAAAAGGIATERMRIDSAGNVAIGQTTAAYKLDVDGDIRVKDGHFIYAGDSADLKITHGGHFQDHSTITTATGNLYLINEATNADIRFLADNGSGGTETYFQVDGGLRRNVSYKHIQIIDDFSFLVGDNGEFSIKHSGAGFTTLTNTTGHLYLQQLADDKDIILECDDGSGGTATYLTLDGSATNIKVDKDMRFNDNVDAEFGSSGDFKVYHDGSNTYLEQTNAGTGNIIISNANDDADIVLQSDNGSGGVTPYITLDGSNTITQFLQNTFHPDNIQARFGSSNDLRLHHNGTSSFVENMTGNLHILNNADEADIIFQSDDGSGGVADYIKIDGGQTITQFLQHIFLPDNIQARFGSSNDLQIKHDGAVSLIDNYTGNLHIRNYSDDGDITFRNDDGSGGDTQYFRLDGGLGYNVASKHIKYNDTVAAMFGDSLDLHISHDTANSLIHHIGTGDLILKQDRTDGDILFQSDDGSGGTATYLTVNGSREEVVTSKPLIQTPGTVDPANNGELAFTVVSNTSIKLKYKGTDGTVRSTTLTLS